MIATLMNQELVWWNSKRSHDELTQKLFFLNPESIFCLISKLIGSHHDSITCKIRTLYRSNESKIVSMYTSMCANIITYLE